jgi:hypothetical protein
LPPRAELAGDVAGGTCRAEAGFHSSHITARIAIALVLKLVDLGRLLEDLLVIEIRVTTRARVKLRAIHRDHPNRHHPPPAPQTQHLTEQPSQSVLVTLAKPRDRRVIRLLVCRDHPERNVVHACLLDPARRPLPLATGVQQQRNHHPRVVRRAIVPISAIRTKNADQSGALTFR